MWISFYLGGLQRLLISIFALQLVDDMPCRLNSRLEQMSILLHFFLLCRVAGTFKGREAVKQ